jgi:hypothetical protein
LVGDSISEGNDLHVYDPVLKSWIEIITAVGTPPAARRFFGFTSARNKLYVHGGKSIGGGRRL